MFLHEFALSEALVNPNVFTLVDAKWALIDTNKRAVIDTNKAAGDEIMREPEGYYWQSLHIPETTIWYSVGRNPVGSLTCGMVTPSRHIVVLHSLQIKCTWLSW